MKEKIAVAIAVVLIGLAASACTRSNTDEGDTSSNRSDVVSNSSENRIESDLSSDKNGVSSFVSSSMDAIDSMM